MIRNLRFINGSLIFDFKLFNKKYFVEICKSFIEVTDYDEMLLDEEVEM